jgi:hypothetical protein
VSTPDREPPCRVLQAMTRARVVPAKVDREAPAKHASDAMGIRIHPGDVSRMTGYITLGSFHRKFPAETPASRP